MNSQAIRYGTRFGCRFGQPHNMMRIGENPQQIWERCLICNKKFRWNKGNGGRVDNPEYLKTHVRQFAQPNGSTKRAFMKLYRPDETVITL